MCFFYFFYLFYFGANVMLVFAKNVVDFLRNSGCFLTFTSPWLILLCKISDSNHTGQHQERGFFHHFELPFNGFMRRF